MVVLAKYLSGWKAKILSYLLRHCYSVIGVTLIVNGVFLFLLVFTVPESVNDTEDIWEIEVRTWLKISMWMTVPMILDIILDFRKSIHDQEKRSMIFSRILLVLTLFIPPVIQINLPYDSRPEFLWKLQAGLLRTQMMTTIGGLFVSMYRENQMKYVKGKFNVILSSIFSFCLQVFLQIIDFTCRTLSATDAVIFIVGALRVLAILYMVHVIVTHLRLLWKERVNGAFVSHRCLSDFLHGTTLLFYILGFFAIGAVGFFRGELPTLFFSSIHSVEERIILNVVLTVILTVIPMRVSVHRAEFESQRLTKKLNTIRYVSHEMRTPLNTVLLGIQYMDDLLTEFQRVCDRACCAEPTHELQRVSPPGMDYGGPIQPLQRGKVGLSFRSAEAAKESDHSTFPEGIETCRARITELQENLALVKSGCDVTVATLNNLLTADKLEDEKLSLDAVPLNPWHFVYEVASSFHLIAADKKINFQVDCREHESKWFDSTMLLGDQFKLSQVIRNFISNALKFTPTHGLVSVTVEQVKRRTSFNGMKGSFDSGFSDQLEEFNLKVSVQDSGAGISKENQKQVFGQYVQFNAAQLQQGKGSGLGLWISKKIVELHGGKIGMSSEGEGHGCTFFFELPLESLELSTDHSPPEDPSSQGPPAEERTFDALRLKYGIEPIVTSLPPDNPQTTNASLFLLLRRGMIAMSPSNVMRSRSRVSSTDSLENNGVFLTHRNTIDNDLEMGIGRQESSERPVAGRGVKVAPLARIQSYEVKTEDEVGIGEPLGCKLPEKKRGATRWDEGLRVLIVDDSAVNRKVLRSLLKTAGHLVKDLCNGQEFLDFWSEEIEGGNAGRGAKLSSFDVVLMDDSMPGLSGPEATRKARSLGFTGLVVGVTGNAFEDQIQNYLACGANAVLQKPLDLKVLKETLEELM